MIRIVLAAALLTGCDTLRAARKDALKDIQEIKGSNPSCVTTITINGERVENVCPPPPPCPAN